MLDKVGKLFCFNMLGLGQVFQNLLKLENHYSHSIVPGGLLVTS